MRFIDSVCLCLILEKSPLMSLSTPGQKPKKNATIDHAESDN